MGFFLPSMIETDYSLGLTQVCFPTGTTPGEESDADGIMCECVFDYTFVDIIGFCMNVRSLVLGVLGLELFSSVEGSLVDDDGSC